MKERAKVLFLNNSPGLAKTLWTDEAFKLASNYGFSIEIPEASKERPAWESMIGGFDAVVTSWNSPRLEGGLLKSAKRLKIVGHAAGSVCSAVSEAVYEAGVAVTTSNPVMAEAVAEWSLLATLLSSRRLQNYASVFGLSKMKWAKRDEARDLRSMTVGVWGVGDISSRFLKMLAPLKPKRVLVHSKHASAEALKEAGASPAGFEELLAESDIIHLLAGLTPENLDRIGAKELGLVKDGATLINSGRARLVEERALIEELGKGRFNAILDVYHQEPLPLESPLMRFENVLLTPHNAGGPGKELYVPFVLEEFDRFFSGRPLESEITLKRHRTMTVEALALRPASGPATPAAPSEARSCVNA